MGGAGGRSLSLQNTHSTTQHNTTQHNSAEDTAQSAIEAPPCKRNEQKSHEDPDEDEEDEDEDVVEPAETVGESDDVEEDEGIGCARLEAIEPEGCVCGERVDWRGGPLTTLRSNLTPDNS